MPEAEGHEEPLPLVETNWLSERLDNPDLRFLDCSVIMHVTDDGNRKYSSVNVDCELLVDPNIHTFLPDDQLHSVFESAGALDADAAVTYCGGGVAASLNALAPTLPGVPQIAVYHGSIAEWSNDPVLPMETGRLMTLESGRPLC